MRILLDACVPERLARFIPGHDVTTVREFLGTTDFDDGPLLDQVAGRFDVFVTVDKNLRFQQNLHRRASIWPRTSPTRATTTRR